MAGLIELVAFYIFLPAALSETPVIRTTYGTIRGETVNVGDKRVDVFMGIPYAKPPIKNLRFRKPEPLEPWLGIKNTTHLPHSCHQMIDTSFNRFPGVEMWNPNRNLSEDCLYLNLWVPKTEETNNNSLATIVWVYGGGFTSGTSTLDVYEGRWLAAGNDVIVMSMNYRVGPLGFLYLANDRAPGNVGLLDQSLSLRWIHDNVGRFGGDPEKITLFGESAGAAGVSLHLFSPHSKPFFNNAIMMSGTALASWAVQPREKALSRARELARRINCSRFSNDETMDCLLRADPQRLSEKQWDTAKFYFDIPFGPVVDGFFLEEDVRTLMRKNLHKKCNLLMGVVKDEATYFLVYNIKKYFGVLNKEPMDVKEFRETIRIVNKPANLNSLQVNSIVYLYEGSRPPYSRNSYREAVNEISGDLSFKCPTIEFARSYSNVSNVYLYSFEHRSSLNPWPQWMGVMHGYEIEFTFGLPLDQKYNYSEEEKAMSKHLMKLWTHFSKTGNPSEVETSEWPPYTTTDQKYLKIQAEPTFEVQQGIRHAQCTFWWEYFPSLRSCQADFFNGSEGISPVSGMLVFSSVLCVTIFTCTVYFCFL